MLGVAWVLWGVWGGRVGLRGAGGAVRGFRLSIGVVVRVLGDGRLRMSCRALVKRCCHFQLRGHAKVYLPGGLTIRPAITVNRCLTVVVVVSCSGGCVLPMRAHHPAMCCQSPLK